VTCLAAGDILRRALHQAPAATTATLGTEIDDVVRRLDDVEMVFDDDDRVARFDESMQTVEQS